MILLDAYPLVALLAAERAADEVEELLRSGGTAIPAVNLGEAIDLVQRVHGVASEDVHRTLAPLIGAPLVVLPQGEPDAWRASEIRLRHYNRATAPLSLADCFLIAAAGSGDEIATSDPPLAAAARKEGFVVIALPDSTGRRP